MRFLNSFGYFFLLVLMSLFVVLATPSAHAVLIDKINAIVNNETVLKSDIERLRYTLNLRKEIDPIFSFFEGLDAASPSQEILLSFLIQEHLIHQNFPVQEPEVEQEIKNVMKGNNLSQEQLATFLSSKGYNYNDYYSAMRASIEKRTLLDREIRSRVNISEDDMRNFYFNSQLKNSSAPLEYSIQVVVIDLKNYKSEKFAQEAAERAYKAIKQGEPFGEVAHRMSDDPSSSQGGDLGFVSSDQLNESLLTSIKKLKIGNYSDVFKVGNLFYLVRLNDVRSTEHKKFESDKEQIRELLAKEEYKRQLNLWANRIQSSAYIKTND